MGGWVRGGERGGRIKGLAVACREVVREEEGSREWHDWLRRCKGEMAGDLAEHSGP